jgi:hypothetical protein
MTVTMKTLTHVIICALLATGAFAATPSGSAGTFAITTDSVDNGGKRVTVSGTSGPIAVDQSAGGILGISTGGIYTIRHGYIAQLYEDAPTIGSTLTALPNPATTAQTVVFSVQATDEDPFTIFWDFGDGAVDNSNGASVSHLYTTPSIYTATVTITDADFLVSTATVQVTVIAAATPTDPNDIDGDGIPNAVDNDADGDGFPNSLEIASNTDPLNPASTPLNNAAAGTPLPLALSKMFISLNFKSSPRDSISLSGTLPVSDGFLPLGQPLIVDVGGVAQLFSLDKRGGAKSSTARFAVKIKAKKGVVAAQTSNFALKMLKGDFSDELADENLTDTSTDKAGEARSVIVSLLFDNKFYQATKSLTYKAKAGISGKAK